MLFQSFCQTVAPRLVDCFTSVSVCLIRMEYRFSVKCLTQGQNKLLDEFFSTLSVSCCASSRNTVNDVSKIFEMSGQRN